MMGMSLHVRRLNHTPNLHQLIPRSSLQRVEGKKVIDPFNIYISKNVGSNQINIILVFPAVFRLDVADSDSDNELVVIDKENPTEDKKNKR